MQLLLSWLGVRDDFRKSSVQRDCYALLRRGRTFGLVLRALMASREMALDDGTAFPADLGDPTEVYHPSRIEAVEMRRRSN